MPLYAESISDMAVEAGFETEFTYMPLANCEGEGGLGEELLDVTRKFSFNDGPTRGFVSRYAAFTLYLLTSIMAGFILGTLNERLRASSSDFGRLSNVALSIPLPTVRSEFVYSSPFSKEPPQGEGSGDESEPIWDALIPNGLGYFTDEVLAPRVSIPTVFHQLHCLYALRRLYYTQTDDELKAFDFGKNRTVHAAHCFDYLQQSITCASDTTVEPATDTESNPDGFLGIGFPRQCRDFGVLKEFLQERRAFDATGVLAHGLEHGVAHIRVGAA